VRIFGRFSVSSIPGFRMSEHEMARSNPAEADGFLYDGSLDLVRLMNILIRRWRMVMGLPLVIAFITAGYTLTVPSTYVATARFMPEGREDSGVRSSLGSLMGQFGTTLGVQIGNQSSDVFAEVITSHELMSSILKSSFPDPRQESSNAADSVSLLVLLEKDDSDPDLRLALEDLRGRVSASVDPQTGIIQLSVESGWPTLSADVANHFVALLDEYNEETRRSRTGRRRSFVEERSLEAEVALRDTESELREFLERNRSWDQSPQLVFEEGRLRRVVAVQQEIYQTLAREYELARIDEVDEQPILTLIDPAVPPLTRSKPKRRQIVLVMVVLTMMFSVTWAYVGEYFASLKARGDESMLEMEGLLTRVSSGLMSRVGTRRTDMSGQSGFEDSGPEKPPSNLT